MTIINRMRSMADRMTSGQMSSPILIEGAEETDYDPATGKVVVNKTSINSTAIRMSVRQHIVDGKLILGEDVEFYINRLSDKCEEFDIKSTDTITFDNDSYVIKDVKPWNFNGVSIGFKVRARVAK